MEYFERNNYPKRRIEQKLNKNDSYNIPRCVCPTCLSKDRDLYVLNGQQKNLLFRLGFTQNMQFICWECYAMMKNIFRFKNTASRAQKFLKNEAQFQKGLSTIGSLSRLKNTTVTVLSVTFTKDQKDPITSMFIKRQSDVQTRSGESYSVKQHESGAWLSGKPTITAKTPKPTNPDSELPRYVYHKEELNIPTSTINIPLVATEEKPIEHTIINLNSVNFGTIDITELPFNDEIVFVSDDDDFVIERSDKTLDDVAKTPETLQGFVINKNNASLEASDTTKLEKAPPLNNVDVLKTADALEDYAIDKNDATLEALDTTTVETASPFNNVEVLKTAETLVDFVIDKNDATLEPSDTATRVTASPLNNVDVLKTAESLVDFVIDKNDATLELSDTATRVTASPLNNVEVLKTAETLVDFVIDKNDATLEPLDTTTRVTALPFNNVEVLKTAETLVDFVIDKNDATLEPLDTTTRVTASPFNNVEVLKTAETLVGFVIDKNDAILEPSDTATRVTASPLNNVDVLKTADALEDYAIDKNDATLEALDTATVETASPFNNVEVLKTADSLVDSVNDKNDATLKASDITKLETTPPLDIVNISKSAEALEDSVFSQNYATSERTGHPFNVSKSSESLLEDSAAFKPCILRFETSDSDVTSINAVNVSKPIQLEDSILTNQTVTAIELRDATKPETELTLNYLKKSKTAKIPLEDSVLIDQSRTRLRKTDVTTLETKIRKRKKTKSKRSILNFKVAKTTETPYENSEIEILITTINKLALNSSNEEVTSNIANVNNTDTVDNFEVGYVEAPESSGQVISKILPVTKSVVDELQHISKETLSEMQNNNCVIYDKPEMLLCMEEFNDSLEHDDIENTGKNFPSIGVRRNDNNFKGMSTPNCEKNSTNAIETQQAKNKRGLYKTIVNKAFVAPCTTSQSNETTKLNNNNTNMKMQDEQLKGRRQLVINRVTADGPTKQRTPKQKTNRQPQQRSCVYFYIEEVKLYDELQSLETLKHVLRDHSYFKSALLEYRRTCQNMMSLKRNPNESKKPTPTPNKSVTPLNNIPVIKKQKRLLATKMAGVENNVRIINDWEQQQMNLSSINGQGTTRRNFKHHNVSSSARRESCPTTGARSESNTIVNNIENTQENTYNEITLMTDIKVEKYIPESIEKNREFNDDTDWTVDRCKVKLEEVDIEPELSLEDVCDNSTDSASETDYLEKIQRGSPFDYCNSVPGDNDYSKLSYYDYLYKPSDLNNPAQNHDNNCLQNVSDIAPSDSNNITADFEMNNITVSFANSLYYPDPPTEATDPNPIIETVNTDNDESSPEDLLEPVYYTDWTDQTYDYQYQNVTELPNNKKKSLDPKKTELVSVKKEKTDEQPKNKQCGKRNKNKRPHPSQKKNEGNEDYNNKLRFVSKRIKRQSQVTNETENEKVSENINYEKLLLHPVVLLEKVDKVLQQRCDVNKFENPPDMITRVKVEPTETLEEIAAFDKVKVKDEPTENETYVFKTLKQEIMPKTDVLQNTNEANEMKVIETDKPNSTKKINNTMHILKTFRDSEDLKALREKAKQQSKFKDSKYKCESCIRIFSSDHGLHRHFYFSHAEVLGKHKCEVCECRFKVEKKLKSHMHTHKRCYQCRWCPDEYLHQHDLKEHVVMNHPAEYEERIRDRSYKCEMCSKEYRNYVSMYLHRRSIHDYRVTSNRAKLIQNELSVTINNVGLTDYNSSLAENNAKSTGNDWSLTANNSSVTENCSSLPENNVSSTENKLSFTENLSSKENNFILTEKNLSATENNLSATENNMKSTGNNFSSTENNLSAMENNLSLTENNSSSTEKNLSVTENNLRLKENNLSQTENNLSSTDNNLSLTENDSSFMDDAANTCPVCNMDIWTSFACSKHCVTRSATRKTKS